MSFRYKKLQDGSWGIVGPAGDAQPGAEVTVTTKAGAEKVEVIQNVIWSGTTKWSPEPTAICSIKQTPKTPSQEPPPPPPPDYGDVPF